MATTKPTAQDARRALTLRQLRDRLSVIIAYHEEAGWEERNNQPVAMRIPGGQTPTGRARPASYQLVALASAGSLGIVLDDGTRLQVTELT